MVKRFIIAAILLALVGGGLIGFNIFRDRMITSIFANLPEQVRPVNTVTVSPVEWEPELSAIGSVNSVQGVDLTVEGAGIVRSVNFTANQKVEAGDVLLELDAETQKADLEAARTQYSLAKSNLERARRLQQRGVTADANLDTTEANYQAAEAQLARAEAVLRTRTLVAPFSGTIGLPRIDPGSYISPGAVVATLQDLDRMRVDFSLPEQDLEDLYIGQSLRIIQGSEGDAVTYKGKVTGIDPRVNTASRMIALRGEVVGADHKLTPGQFVRVAAALPLEEGVIALPQTAVMSSLYGDYVYLVRERETEGRKADEEPVLEVAQVFVQLGRRSAVWIEVKSDNLKPGDVIVNSGQNRLSHGGAVKIDNTVNPDSDRAAAGAAEAKAPAEEAAQE